MRIHEDALICRVGLDVGPRLIQEISPQRISWLNVVRDPATPGGVVLAAGDGTGVTVDRAVSITAPREIGIRLLDLRERPPKYPHNGDVA